MVEEPIGPIDPVDLSPLDPRRDAAAFDARVRAIVADAVFAAPGDPVTLLASWTRPALAAAAVIAAVALVPLFRSNAAAQPVTTADILGIPAPVMQVARSHSPPGVVELAEALNVEQDHAR